jgi:hypothetical protein
MIADVLPLNLILPAELDIILTQSSVDFYATINEVILHGQDLYCSVFRQKL